MHKLARQSCTCRWNRLHKTHSYKILCYTLTYKVCHEVLGILQWIIKPEAFGDCTAVLWDVFFVFLVATSAITTGSHIPLFWAFCCMSWHQRWAARFFRAAQEYEIPLPQPEMGETGLCCGPFPLKEEEEMVNFLS